MVLVEPVGQVQARLEPREAVGDLNVRILIFSLSSAAAFLPRPGCLHEATENLMVAVMVYRGNWLNLTSYITIIKIQQNQYGDNTSNISAN